MLILALELHLIIAKNKNWTRFIFILSGWFFNLLISFVKHLSLLNIWLANIIGLLICCMLKLIYVILWQISFRHLYWFWPTVSVSLIVAWCVVQINSIVVWICIGSIRLLKVSKDLLLIEILVMISKFLNSVFFIYSGAFSVRFFCLFLLSVTWTILTIFVVLTISF